MDYVVVINREWRRATRGLSIGARGLLALLLQKAAFSGRAEIRIDIAKLAPQLDTSRGRDSFEAWLYELQLRRLVRQRPGGLFVIAPDLWSLEPRDGSHVLRRLQIVPPSRPEAPRV